jgi:hypothetical protein
MASDQDPVSDEEIEALREEMASQREEVREALAEDLGGEPEDFDAEKHFSERTGTGEPVADGGQ